METAIPAVVIAGILLICAGILAGTTNDSVSNVTESWRDIEEISEERLGTHLSVVSATVEPGEQAVNITLRSEGRTTISDFQHMDLIANYNGTLGRYNTWLPYTEDVLQPDNSWKITGFASDNKNPGMLDMSEEMTIRIQLAPAITGPTDRWISLATATGVSYTISF